MTTTKRKEIRMRHNNNTESAKEMQLGVLALKMENEKLKNAVKDYERRISALKGLCRAMSAFDLGDGTHTCQFGRVPIYEIARCFETFPPIPLGNNDRYQEAGWIEHKE